MPIRGAKLKPEARTRVRPTFDWTEVQDVPFEGAPALPFRHAQSVADWWADVSTMPHCALWRPGDWRYAIECARLVRKLHNGKGSAAEVRAREKVMGTTMDARRDLRIRYVENIAEDERLGVAAIEDYRKRLG